MKKVNSVLRRVDKARLKLDPDKFESAIKKTKYLGFVINLGRGIEVDPKKAETIKSWEAPTSVKGVRSFLGFAYFYRDSIPSFSEIA